MNMLKLSRSVIRYNFCLLALCLVLFAPVTPGQKRGGKRKAPATPAAAPVPAPVPTPQIEKMDRNEQARGGPVIFTGVNFPVDPKDINVFLNGAAAGTASLVNPEKTSFLFVIPSDVSLGTYNVMVKFTLNKVQLPFPPPALPEPKLTVYSESGKVDPKITAVSPLLTYPEKEVYGFDIIGEGFSKKGADNGLVIQNRGEIQGICWADDQKCDHKDPNLVQAKAVSPQQLTFSGIPQKHRGVNDLQVRVGDQYSNVFQITLARVNSKLPIQASLVVFVLLFGLVLFLTSRGLRTSPIAGKRFGLITALFLDKETDTYSLSRFQFFVWTAVAIFSYVYLVLSRSLIQWKLEFVDVPSGLPGIILISAGTTVLAQGITNSKGTKGAGEIHPSMSDFISVGGVVVPERFQFFVWTLLGASVFVFLVLLNDPGTLKDLPQVPNGFLELMGVSSAGYLGGKLARKPGPIIDEILAKLGSLELTLKGRNLSKDASLIIDGDEVSSDNIDGPPVMIPDEELPSTTMGKELRFKIKDPKPEWLTDGRKLTLINPDGQKAVWAYQVGPNVTLLTDSSGMVSETHFMLRLKGANIDALTEVNLETPEKTAWPTEVTVNFETPDLLTVESDIPVIDGETTLRRGTAVVRNPTGPAVRIDFVV